MGVAISAVLLLNATFQLQTNILVSKASTDRLVQDMADGVGILGFPGTLQLDGYYFFGAVFWSITFAAMVYLLADTGKLPMMAFYLAAFGAFLGVACFTVNWIIPFFAWLIYLFISLIYFPAVSIYFGMKYKN